MEKIIHAIIKYKKSILIAFLIIAGLSAVISSLVSVNYDMVDYLPKDAQSTTAIKIMNREFHDKTPNARVMLANVSVREALEYKKELAAIDGVTSINWLDDVIGLDTLKMVPLDFLDPSVSENYYKDNNALMSLTVKRGKEKDAMDAVYKIIGKNNAASGDAVNTSEIQAMSVSEVLNAFAILLPIILIILIITTSSWLEPLLFFITIGIAILINMGTNIIFGEISFISKTVSPILQLAVSLDYAIFLLHSFNGYRSSYQPKKAMSLAMKQALPTVAASAATTVIGFAALIFMRFGIGADLGVNLFKGVLLSFISVTALLPVITLLCYEIIDKTKHRKLIPDFKKAGSLLMKMRIPFLIIALIVIIPCILAQSHTRFMYGTGKVAKTSRVAKDTSYIEKKFGKQNTLVLLVPGKNIGKESELCDSLSKIPRVTSVVSYVTAIGSKIPKEFVPKGAINRFYSKNYTRIILYTNTAKESPDAFNTVQSVLDTAAANYDNYYLTGQSATLYDMKQVVSKDRKLVNLLAIAGIFLVLLITFRSPVLPVLLLFTIETAIWINLSFPYFTGRPLIFIGFLIICTVQLGATVDYAILFTNSYLNKRKTLLKKDAMRITAGENLIAILTSATILATAGFTLAFTSSDPIVSELGTLLGRGTLLSLVMVTCVLPALLVLFDNIIRKTTLKIHQ